MLCFKGHLFEIYRCLIVSSHHSPAQQLAGDSSAIPPLVWTGADCVQDKACRLQAILKETVHLPTM